MQIIPAIYLQDGACLDISSGEPEILERDPALRARRLEAAGAPALHLVEVSSLESGRLERLLDILDVLMAVAVPVQVRAGLWRDEEIGQVLSRGAARVVVEARHLDPARRAACAARFSDRVVGALELDPAVSAADARRRAGELQSAGFSRLLCRILSGSPIPTGGLPPMAAEIAAMGVPLIWEGGVGSLSCIRALAALPAVEGVIVHQALMDGRFTVAAACLAAGAG